MTMVRRLMPYKSIQTVTICYPNHYERLKTAFIEMRDEDNLRLFNVKKAPRQLKSDHISRTDRPAMRVSRNPFLSQLIGSDSIRDERRRYMPFGISQTSKRPVSLLFSNADYEFAVMES
jgi:hypothetical protein